MVQNPNSVPRDEEYLPYPAVAPVVFFGLKQTTRPRKWCLKVACSSWLDYGSRLMALLSFAIVCMYEPYEDTSDLLMILEPLTFSFFMVEMLMKMVALGVFGYQGSYLSNNWNKFDVFINSVNVVDYFLAFLGINWQISKPLQPMRLTGRIPSMQALMKVLLDMTPMLVNVFILYICTITVFAIVGVQLWAGQLRNRCFLGEDIIGKYNVSMSPFYQPKDNERFPFICSPDGKHGTRRCSDVPPYMQNGNLCSLAAPDHASAANHSFLTAGGVSADACVNWHMYYNVCRTGIHNPHSGAINFDNIGYAWLTIFQVVTLEGWTEIMFYVMDTYSFWSFIVFIPVTIMGSFVMMNVCAVVIVSQFAESTQRDKGQRPAGAASIAWLCDMLTSCLRVISSVYNSRRRDAVQPNDSGEDSLMVHVWTPFKRKLKCIVDSKLFNQVIMFAIFVSVVTMAIEHHGQPKALTRMLKVTNIVFIIIFIVEMAMKLLVLSGAYFRDPNNVFDFVIVMSSVWEVIAKADSRLSILRAFRLLRFVRLVKFLPHLRTQLLVLKRTIQEAAVLCGLLLIGMLVFSVLGMQLFGHKFSFKTQNGVTVADRKNFDTILWSMVTVFQILTQEDWNLVLYNAMSATSPWAALYFVGLILLEKNIILNILMGIVVESFQERRSSSPLSSCTNLTHLTPSGGDDNEENDAISGDCSPSGHSSTEMNTEEETDTNERSLNLIQRVLRWCKEHEDWSLYVLSPQNRLRVCCQRVISYTMFDHVILCFILLNCVTIAMERPGIAPESGERWIINMSGYVFSTIFLIEMLLKVLAHGLVFGKESYCRSPWNVVDGSLVVLSLVDVLVSLASRGKNKKLGILKVLRLLRTFRPLRVIKRAPKLKLALEALIASVKPIGNIALICCAFFLFFGILGVQLFKGKFFYCVGQDTRNITSKSDCLSANYQWVRKTYNFDNLPQALLSLFVMFSKDSWVSIMYDGLDAVGVDKQPVRNHNEWMLLFFISFMIISFVLLDMFIGVMVETFHQCQQEQKIKDQWLREEDNDEMQVESGEPEQPYYTHYSPMRRSIYDLCVSDFLDYFMTVIVFISVFMMAFEHYNQPEYIEKFVEYSYYVFTAMLIMEILLKLVAFGVLEFFKIRWNLLDVAVALISVISIVVDKTFAKVFPINPSVLRVCRVLRLAQVLKAKKIRLLLRTIIKTLSQVENICLLFTFFFFIYAVLGVELFGKLSCSDDNPCHGLHRHANFRHFGMALLTLYQVCTGDNWSGIMRDTLRSCRPGDDGCLSYLHWVSPICFTSFVVMGQFVLVNLVVAAIMQALEDSNENKTINLPAQEGEAEHNAVPPPPGQ